MCILNLVLFCINLEYARLYILIQNENFVYNL